MVKLTLTHIAETGIFLTLMNYSRRELPCLDLVNTLPMSRRGSRTPPFYRSRKSKNALKISKSVRVPIAGGRRGGTICGRERCIISAIRVRGGQSMFNCNIPFIIVASVKNMALHQFQIDKNIVELLPILCFPIFTLQRHKLPNLNNV